MTLRSKVAKVSAEKNPTPVSRGRLAEDYDGIGEFVAVSMSMGSTSSALAKVAPGAATTGQSIPAGTQVAVISQQGHLEVISMGSKVATGYSLSAGENNELEATIEPVNLVAANVVDYSGNTSISSGGLAGAWGKLVQSGGLYNPDFELAPQELDADISEDNLIPYWSELVVVGTGTHIQVVDSQDAFGQVLRCSIDSDATSGAYTWIGQTVPRTEITSVIASFRYTTPAASATVIFDVILDWLAAEDLVSNQQNVLRRDGYGVVIDGLAGAAVNDHQFSHTISNHPPEGATSLRVWVGLRRLDSEAGSNIEFDILSVKLAGPPIVLSGSENVALDNAAYGQVWVGYYPPTPIAPNTVQATVKTSTSLYFATVNSISATGFNLRVINRDGNAVTTSVWVNWLAIIHQSFDY